MEKKKGEVWGRKTVALVSQSLALPSWLARIRILGSRALRVACEVSLFGANLGGKRSAKRRGVGRPFVCYFLDLHLSCVAC